MIRKRFKSFLPVIVFFVVLNGFFISGKTILHRFNADQDVLIIGNLVLFLVTLVSFFVLQSGLKNPNPNVFVRSVIGSFIIKFFVCIVAAFIYISLYKKSLNKAALFICMGLFLVYLFIEVSIFTRLLKQEKNA
jgi:hypothetical protein